MTKKAQTVYLESEDLKLLARIAKKKGTTASKILRKWMRRYVSKNKRVLKGDK